MFRTTHERVRSPPFFRVRTLRSHLFQQGPVEVLRLACAATRQDQTRGTRHDAG